MSKYIYISIITSICCQVPYFEWHSPQLAEREDRVQYLEQSIFQDVVPMETDIATHPSEQVFSGEEPAMAFDGLTRAQDPDLVEDPLVMRVLHTFDRMGGRRTWQDFSWNCQALIPMSSYFVNSFWCYPRNYFLKQFYSTIVMQGDFEHFGDFEQIFRS